MSLELIKTFTQLGEAMSALFESEPNIVGRARIENPWFNEDMVKYSCEQWAAVLEENQIKEWLGDYIPSKEPKKVGIIMAGNIPFVGLHDLLSVVASGNHGVCKLSSQDKVLMKWAILTLQKINPLLKDFITIADDRLNNLEALIATGSDNSARYFEYYFRKIPKIIRKNRSSVAIVEEETSEEELTKLADDIFMYFGLGCRNVGKVFLPQGYDVTKLIDHLEVYNQVINHHKYANNYTYHKAILLMNLDKHLDNGFLILQEKQEEIKPPLSNLFYSFYDNKKELVDSLSKNESIQCIIGDGLVPFGDAQNPSLLDYADNINTLEFLRTI